MGPALPLTLAPGSSCECYPEPRASTPAPAPTLTPTPQPGAWLYAAEGPGYGVWGGPAREAAVAGEAAAAEATARASAEGASRGGVEPRGRGYYCFRTRAAARACFEALAAGEVVAGEGGGALGEGRYAAVAAAAAAAAAVAAAAAPSQHQAITRLVEGTVEQAAKPPAAVGAAGGQVGQVEFAEQAAADTAAAERATAEAKVAIERLKVVQRRTAVKEVLTLTLTLTLSLTLTLTLSQVRRRPCTRAPTSMESPSASR